MASETLSVPEEKLWEVIQVIRAGMGAKVPGISSETKTRLKQWCDDEEQYLRRTGQLIVMTVSVEPEKKPKKKRLTAAEVAHYHNTWALPKKRAEYEKNCKEGGFEIHPDQFAEVKSEDLDLARVWECTESPTKFCVYDWDNTGEDCIFCGQPEERK